MGKEPRRNLEAHLLDDAAVLSALERVWPNTADVALDRTKARSVYDSLCEIRRRRIAEELIGWELELRNQAERERKSTSDVLPAIRLIKKEAEDLIRVAGYAPSIMRRLTALHRRRLRLSRRKNGELALAYTPDGAGKRQVIRIDLSADGARIGLKLSDRDCADDFVARFPPPEVETQMKKNSKRCSLSCQDQAGIAKAIEILDWIEMRLWPVREATTEQATPAAAP